MISKASLNRFRTTIIIQMSHWTSCLALKYDARLFKITKLRRPGTPSVTLTKSISSLAKIRSNSRWQISLINYPLKTWTILAASRWDSTIEPAFSNVWSIQIDPVTISQLRREWQSKMHQSQRFSWTNPSNNRRRGSQQSTLLTWSCSILMTALSWPAKISAGISMRRQMAKNRRNNQNRLLIPQSSHSGVLMRQLPRVNTSAGKRCKPTMFWWKRWTLRPIQSNVCSRAWMARYSFSKRAPRTMIRVLN